MNKVTVTVMLILNLTRLISAQETSLTVYNQNMALIREIKQISLSSGISQVKFTDVALRIDPTSVHLKSLNAPDALHILEQNFEYDLISAAKIMEKYVDNDVRMVTEKGEVFSGKLLSKSQDDVVLLNDEGGITVVRTSTVQHFEFPELPQGLITRPTLIWQVDNRGSRNHQTELSYLTEGIGWHMEYIARVDPTDQKIILSGWVSIDNRSGATYSDAKLKLVAGDIHLVQDMDPRRPPYPEQKRVLLQAAVPQFEERSFFEYHLYTLRRKTTLKNNQTKQISLFQPAETSARKLFIFDGSRYGEKIRVNLAFDNRKQNGLGISLPAGKIRVYKEDTDGTMQFIGEDRIDHTPVDEKIRIFVGTAFDIVGERKRQTFKKVSDSAREESYSISLRNHKKESVDIVVVEHLYGDWTITKSSHDHIKKDAQTFEFKVNIPAKGEISLNYSAMIRL